MSPPEILNQRFWGRQADKNIRVEGAADSGFGRSLLNIPRRWGVNRSHGDLCVLHGLDDGRERLPDLAGKAEAEDGIDDMIGRCKGGREVVHKGDAEVLELLGKALHTR